MATKIVIDCSTGVVEEVELTEAELAERESNRLAHEKIQAEKAVAEAEKATKRSALLDKLGLTEDDAKLLFS